MTWPASASNCEDRFPRFYTATLRAYLYAGLISSGPWVLSIVSVMLIGVLSLGVVVPDVLVRQFLITVTYLMALSLIFTGDCNCSSPASFPIACSSASTRRSCPTWWACCCW